MTTKDDIQQIERQTAQVKAVRQEIAGPDVPDDDYILPCPFCGNKIDNKSITSSGININFVSCHICGCDGPVSKNTPIKSWNTRA